MSERLTEERFAYIFEYRQSEELLEGAMADELFAELAARHTEIQRLVSRVGELEEVVGIYASTDNWFGQFEFDPKNPFRPVSSGYQIAAQALANGGQA
jgi:hypothetical protein